MAIDLIDVVDQRVNSRSAIHDPTAIPGTLETARSGLLLDYFDTSCGQTKIPIIRAYKLSYHDVNNNIVSNNIQILSCEKKTIDSFTWTLKESLWCLPRGPPGAGAPDRDRVAAPQARERGGPCLRPT